MRCANPECGKEFSNFTRDQIIHNKKYCCESCKNKIKVSIRNIREKEKRHLRKLNLLCIKCGVSFNTFKKDQKYCSKKCRETDWKLNNLERYNKAKIKWAKLNPEKIKENRINYVGSGKHKAFKKKYAKLLMPGYVNQLLKVEKHEYKSLSIPTELIELKRAHLKLLRTIKQLTP